MVLLLLLMRLVLLTIPMSSSTFLGGDRIPYAATTDFALTNWTDIYNDYCGKKCVDGKLVFTNRTTCGQEPKCSSCECGQECRLKRTCCPSPQLLLEIVNRAVDNTTNFVEDVRAYSSEFELYKRAECFEVFSRESVIAVGKCPDSWRNDTIERGCVGSWESLDNSVPYTDVITGLTFVNIFCAFCNGYDVYHENGNRSGEVGYLDGRNLKPWPLGVYCDIQNGLYFHDNPTELMLGIMSYYIIPITCHASFVNTHGARRCMQAVRYNDSCGGNGHNDSDSDIALFSHLCLNLPDTFGLRVDGGKNLFCYLCNGFKPFLRTKCESRDYVKTDSEILLHYDFRENSTIERERCWSNDWFDPRLGCTTIFCSPGKVISDDDSGAVVCYSGIKGINILSYSLRVIFVPSEIIPEHYFHAIGAHMENLLKPIEAFSNNRTFELSFTTMLCPLHDHESGVYYKQEIELKHGFKSTGKIPRDELEKQVLEIITQYDLTVATGGDADTASNETQKVKLRVACIGRGLCEVYLRQTRSENCHEVSNVSIGQSHVWLERWGGAVDISPSIVCPYVTRFELVPKRVFQNNDVTFSIRINDKEVDIRDASNISFQYDEFRVCLSFLNDLIEQIKTESSSHVSIDGEDVKDVLETINRSLQPIASVTSCLVLLVSIVTYFRYPSVRTVSRLNTACFCLTLVVSQSSLLAVSLFGFNGSLSRLHCLVTGVVLHYSWISSFAWINVCCLHTYREYTCHVVMGSSNKCFLFYSIYSLGFPLLVVVVVITTATVATGDAFIGYDENVCFLDTDNSSHSTLVLGLLIPLALCLVLNGTVLVLAVKTKLWVHTIGEGDDGRDNGESLHTTVLSAVSSTVCFLVVAAVRLDIPVVLFVYGLFLKLQSVVVFAGIVADRKIVKLLKKTDSLSKKSTNGNDFNAELN